MIDPPDDGEFSWAARVRTDEPVPATFLSKLRAGGLTIGRRRGLLGATFTILLLAAVLSAAVGVGGGDDGLSIDVAGPPPQSTEPSATTVASGSTTGRKGSTTTGLATALFSTPLLTTGDEATTVPLPSLSAARPTPSSGSATSSVPVSSSIVSTQATQATPSENAGTTPPARNVGRTSSTVHATSAPSTPAQPTTSGSATTRPGAVQLTTRPTTTRSNQSSSTQSASSTPIPPANVTNGGIVVGTGGSIAGVPIVLTDIVRNVAGRPVEGVKVDLFSADRKGKRAEFLTSATSDVQGRYRLNGVIGAPTGDGQSCAVLVFIAPDGQAFEETGRFREAVVCPDEAGAALPLVRTLDGSGAASTGLRSVLVGGGKLFLRGSVAGEADRQQKISRYRGPLGDEATVAEYRTAPVVPGVATTGHERVSLDGTGVLAFGDEDDRLTAAASDLVWQLASVLTANPGLRLSIVIAVDPALGERPGPELIRARQRATVVAFEEAGIGIGRLDRQTRRQVTDGRRLGGRSVNSQLEFMLLWP